ncbi:unnamed protein product [Urochloa humidicola]
MRNGPYLWASATSEAYYYESARSGGRWPPVAADVVSVTREGEGSRSASRALPARPSPWRRRRPGQRPSTVPRRVLRRRRASPPGIGDWRRGIAGMG